MKVVDQVPMPRARLAQVTPQDFLALLDRVEKLEKAMKKKESKDGDPSK